ncbi:hypothetical protein ACUR5C_09415 [Aliikangiella sp. IMCC44653]
MSTKYVLELRHRPNLNDDISSRHNRFIKQQEGINSPWNISSDQVVIPSDIAGELSSIVDLNKVLGKGLKGEIVYQLRSKEYLRDTAQYDDNLAIEFNPEKVDFSDLVQRVFPMLVDAFESYRATIYDKTLARSDWMDIVKQVRETGRDVNGRDGVYRINAVNYFDKELCQRSFTLSPEQIVERLDSKVEAVSLLNDGVLLIYNSKPLERSEHESIDSIIRALLS